MILIVSSVIVPVLSKKNVSKLPALIRSSFLKQVILNLFSLITEKNRGIYITIKI
jgi:hypothetical protein